MATSNNGENWYFRKKWDDFRRGDLKVELRFDGQRAVARLYDLGVPETVRMLTAQMPFAVPVVHVAWSGDMVMSAQPFDFGPTEAENAVRLPRVGDLTWDHKVGEICFTYGTAEARLPSGENQLVVFGQVEEGIEAFAEYCRARRFEGLGKIELVRL
jgi:hypothetical protein